MNYGLKGILGRALLNSVLADQALSLLRRNVFTSVELQYLQQKASNRSVASALPSAKLSSNVLSTCAGNDQNYCDNVVCQDRDVAATCFTKDQMDLKSKLLNYMKETSPILDKREHLQSLKSIPTSILNKHTQTVNEVLCYIDVHTLQDLILLMYCGAKVVGELCGVVSKSSSLFRIPPWKNRLQRQLKHLEHDLSQLCELQRGRLLSQAKHQRLNLIYKLSHTPILVVCEQL